ncbi:MAG TPA: sugar ABC transporter permease [Candidatus Limnocylindria bacterium]|nr:sugar ABC transporter permease [Candidatus Limnocylindria bacterium]
MTTAAAATATPRRSRFRRLGTTERRNLRWGLTFISPWLIGFLVFGVFPIVYTFYLSLTRYSGLREPILIGAQNYQRLVADPLFWKSAYNTLYYTLLAVPIGVVVAMLLAMAMNQKVREVTIYRAIFYLPSILPVFAISFIFVVLLNPGYGLVNWLLSAVGLPSPNWLGDPAYTKIALVMIAQLGAGQWALVFLAGLRGIPTDLYESAEIDGAGAVRKFRSITLPLMTPVILYDIIIGLSFGLQVFTSAFILTGGGTRGAAGPDNSLLTYVYYIYKQAFQFGQMGYAAALSVVLFVVSLLLAGAVFRWARGWVFYGAEEA